MLMDFTKVYVPLERLTRLNDVYGQLVEDWEDGMSDGESEDYKMKDVRPVQVQTEDGQWQEYKSEDEDEWVEDDEDMVEESIIIEDVLMDLDGDGVQGSVPGAWPSEERAEEGSIPPRDQEPSPVDNDPVKTEVASISHSELNHAESAKQLVTSWKRFEILPSVPTDHAFYRTNPSNPSHQFLSRLSKEYRALQSSLPGEFGGC